MFPCSIHEDKGSIPGLAQWMGIQHCCEPWCRSQLWLGSRIWWLWCRPVAVALTGSLAWELPHAGGASLKTQERRKEGRKTGRKERRKTGRKEENPPKIWEWCFIQQTSWGHRAQDTASQKTLGNCSEETREEAGYIGIFATKHQVVETSKDHCSSKKIRYCKLWNLALF